MTFRKQAKVLKAKHGFFIIDQLQKKIEEQFLFSLGRIAVSSFPFAAFTSGFILI